MSSDQQQPSLIGGHAQYVKGAAEARLLPPPPSNRPCPVLTIAFTVRSRRSNRLRSLEHLRLSRQSLGHRRDESRERAAGRAARWVRQGRGAGGQSGGLRGDGEGGCSEQAVAQSRTDSKEDIWDVANDV